MQVCTRTHALQHAREPVSGLCAVPFIYSFILVLVSQCFHCHNFVICLCIWEDKCSYSFSKFFGYYSLITLKFHLNFYKMHLLIWGKLVS